MVFSNKPRVPRVQPDANSSQFKLYGELYVLLLQDGILSVLTPRETLNDKWKVVLLKHCVNMVLIEHKVYYWSFSLFNHVTLLTL